MASALPPPGRPHFVQIHSAAACCRSSSARPSAVQIFKTGSGYAAQPDGCEALCASSVGCKYFSHSTDFENCVLCSACDELIVRRGFGFRYTSWKRTEATHWSGRASPGSASSPPCSPSNLREDSWADAGTLARNGTHLHPPPSLKQERSWTAWDRYPAGSKHPGWPTHFQELPPAAYAEWRPEKAGRAPARICVVSTYSTDLLEPTGWGAHTAEVNSNWAMAHGYKFAMFRQKLTNKSLAFTWTKPRAVLFMLEQGEQECAWVFQIDGDAVVNQLSRTIEALIDRLAMGESAGPDSAQLAFTCHSNLGSNDNCHSCRCLRAAERCQPGQLEREFKRSISSGTCIPNTGGYLVRNSATSRDMFRWWAGAGEGACQWRAKPRQPVSVQFAEQHCAQRLKARWPHLVDIVNNRVMNTHSWLNPATPKRGPAVFPVWNLHNLTGCMRSDSFVCHAWGMNDWWCRHSRQCIRNTRLEMFSQHLSARSLQLRALTAARGELYLRFTGGRVGGGPAGCTAR